MAQVPATQRSQAGRMTPRSNYPMGRLARDFDTLFDRLLGGWLAPFDTDQDLGSVRLWDFDVSENDKEIVIRAEMPGFEQNEIDVQINNDALTIKAEKEQKIDGRQEYRSFIRTVVLPHGINPEKVQATYRNGVLELHIPRAENAQPKHIKVQAEQAATGQQGQQAMPRQAGAASSPGGAQGQQAGGASEQPASEKNKR